MYEAVGGDSLYRHMGVVRLTCSASSGLILWNMYGLHVCARLAMHLSMRLSHSSVHAALPEQYMLHRHSDNHGSHLRVLAR